jgi:hypothetical protein
VLLLEELSMGVGEISGIWIATFACSLATLAARISGWGIRIALGLQNRYLAARMRACHIGIGIAA